MVLNKISVSPANTLAEFIPPQKQSLAFKKLTGYNISLRPRGGFCIVMEISVVFPGLRRKRIMNQRNQIFIFVFLSIILGIFSIGCSKKEDPNKGNYTIIEQNENRGAKNPFSHIEVGREIDILKPGYCNCCRSDQQNVVYIETVFMQSFGSFHAGDKVRYGLCGMCREYCNYPYNERCTIRTFLKK